MIKWIHQNKRSLTVFIVLTAVVLAMSFFGIDMPSSRSDRYVIKIGDEKISYDEFQKEKRQRQEMMLQQYKRFFGDNYHQFIDQIYNIPNQEIADDIIARRLLLQEARRLNFYVGNQELANFIRNEIFEGGFSPALYSAYLSRIGLSSRSFEEQVRSDLLLNNYRSLLSDMSMPSAREIESFIKQQETVYEVRYVEFDPAAFEDQIPLDDATLENFYIQNQTDYEIPAKASYHYIALNAESNPELVEIGSDDIEFYYSENETRYATPEEAKVRHIKINLPENADEDTLARVKARAEEAHSKASAGENFDILVAQYSEDVFSIANSGDLGWIQKGKRDERFDKAVFAQKAPGIAPLVFTDSEYHIIKIEEYKEAGLQPLEEVRDAIRQELIKREGPAFVAAKAYEIYDTWQNQEKSLEQIAEENNFTLAYSPALIDQTLDPDPRLGGLTKSVIANAELRKQVVDLGDNSILVEVSDFKEARVPDFSEVKEEVAADYKKVESINLARSFAQNFIDKLNAEEAPDFATLAKNEKIRVEEAKGLSRASPGSGIFLDPLVQDEIFSISHANAKPSKFHSSGGKYYILQIAEIFPPDQSAIKDKTDSYRAKAFENSAGIMLSAVLSRLKASADIDIEKSLLGYEQNI